MAAQLPLQPSPLWTSLSLNMSPDPQSVLCLPIFPPLPSLPASPISALLCLSLLVLSPRLPISQSLFCGSPARHSFLSTLALGESQHHLSPQSPPLVCRVPLSLSLKQAGPALPSLWEIGLPGEMKLLSWLAGSDAQCLVEAGGGAVGAGWVRRKQINLFFSS